MSNSFIDRTGRSHSWDAVRAAARRRAARRVPLVTRNHLDDALDHAVVGLVVALKGQGSAYYVDETTGLYKYAECVEFVRKRTLQRVGRESRKAAKELKALLEADTPGLRAAEGSLSSANADPLNIVGNRDLYAQVNAWRLTLPSDTKAELDLLFCGASQPELATRLGITQQAVAKRQARLRQTLRAMATEAGLLMPDGTYDGGKGSE